MSHSSHNSHCVIGFSEEHIQTEEGGEPVLYKVKITGRKDNNLQWRPGFEPVTSLTQGLNNDELDWSATGSPSL